jgi:hypothetical protein
MAGTITVGELLSDATSSNKILIGSGTTLDLKASAGTTTMPAGSVLQVVQDLGYNEYTTTSSSWDSKMTDVNCIITPSSTSSKILLMASTELEFQYNNTGGSIDFYRSISGGASTYNLSGETNGFTINEGLNRSLVTPVYLDSPSTTSAVTYSISMKYTVAGVGWVGLGGASRITTLIAMEIQG